MRTVGDVISEARAMLNDPTPSGSGPTLAGSNTSRTVGSLVAEVRTLLNDTVTPYRYPDDDLYVYFSSTLLQIRRFRPDAFETLGTAAVPGIYNPTQHSTELFPLDDMFYPVVVQYVLACAELRDDDQALDQKAAALSSGFVANLNMPPFRFSDKLLYSFLNQALFEIRHYRPDLFLTGLRVPMPTYAQVDALTAFPLDEAHFTATVDFIVGRAQTRNMPADPSKPPAYAAVLAARMLA